MIGKDIMGSGDFLYADNWTTETAELVNNLKGPILIVGATGFIGSKIFLSLKVRRNDVFAATSSVNLGWRLNQYKNIHDALVYLDITDVDSI